MEKLGAVSEIIAGQSPPSSTYNQIGEGLPFYQGKADFGEWFPKTRMWCSVPVKISQPGDVLISVRAPVGPTNLCQETSCIGRGLGAIRAKPKMLDSHYLIHFLRSNESKIASLGRGSTFSAITRGDLEDIQIPLPPLAEQKRIAAILDKADAIRRKLQQSLRLSDDFLRSVFLDMFGDPVTNPKGFPKAVLGEIIKLKSGNSLVAKDMTEGGLYPVYGGNGINGYHDSFMFEKPMIVLGRVGAYCGVVHYTLPKSWITDNALYVETMKKKMEPIYLVDALRFANLNQYAGQAGQPLISGGRVYPVEILDVSPDLQASYAAIVTKTQTKIQKSTALLQEAESLFSSLQQRAFRGEL